MRPSTVQRIFAILMLLTVVFAALVVLVPRQSNAQSRATLRDELEHTGLVPALVNQNSSAIAVQGEKISGLAGRIATIEALGIDRRLALLEDYVVTAKENQKLLWGMLVSLALLVIKEIYSAFSRVRSRDVRVIQVP